MILDLEEGRRVSSVEVETETNAAGMQTVIDAPAERMGMLYNAPAIA